MNYDKEVEKCRQSLIYQWAENKTQLTEYPWLCYIAVTNRCNNLCRVCAYSKTMRKDRGMLTPEIFERILEQLPPSIKKVYLIKQGEPFLNKHLETFVTRLRKKRPAIHISLHTNGIVAQKERVEKILPLIDSMGVSISATTPETYRAAHLTDKFDRVMKNLKDISDTLVALGEENAPHVFIDYIRQEANAHEIESDVVEFFKTRFNGLTSVDFHPVYNFQGEIEEGNLEIYKRLPHDKFPCCVFPWSAVTFCYDGKVGYCFVEPRETRFLGDITRQSFEEIWNGPDYRSFRERMVQKKFTALEEDGIYCVKCAWLWNIRSQAPRNLIYGYATDLKTSDKDDEAVFHTLLDYSPEDLFRLGTRYYLRGEIDRALGCFYVLKGLAPEPNRVRAVDEMTGFCLKVVKKYEHLALWQAQLQQEKKDPRQRENTYYKLKP